MFFEIIRGYGFVYLYLHFFIIIHNHSSLLGLRRGFRETPANHTMRLTWTFGNTVFVIRARTVMSWASESHVLGHSHFREEGDRCPTRIYRLMITCIRLGAFPLLRDTFNLSQLTYYTYIISNWERFVKSFLHIKA